MSSWSLRECFDKNADQDWSKDNPCDLFIYFISISSFFSLDNEKRTQCCRASVSMFRSAFNESRCNIENPIFLFQSRMIFSSLSIIEGLRILLLLCWFLFFIFISSGGQFKFCDIVTVMVFFAISTSQFWNKVTFFFLVEASSIWDKHQEIILFY